MAAKYSLTHPRTYQEAIEVLKSRTDYQQAAQVRRAISNRLAPAFINSVTEHKATYFARTIASLADLSTARRVLEAGAGAGYSTQVYTELLPEDGSILVTDFAEAYRGYWSSVPAHPKVSYDVADALALQYDNDTFDRYIFSCGVTHTLRPDIALQEAFRVLSPGGVLVATIPITCSYEETSFFPIRALEIIPNDPTDLLCTVEDPSFLVAMCEEAGFQDVKVFYDIYTFNWTGQQMIDYLSRLIGGILSTLSGEKQQQWRELTQEILDYYIVERKELISYRTVGVRAVKPRA
jgi:ubiquinone/menaquinone biosynthesis C-methylase UbiE